MDSPLVINILWLLPLIVFYITRKMPNRIRSTIRAGSFGLIVAPASLGLYTLYFLGPIAAIFGILGLALSLLHGFVGYNLAILFNLVPSHTVIRDNNSLIISVINGVFWATTYGGFFYMLHTVREKCKKP